MALFKRFVNKIFGRSETTGPFGGAQKAYPRGVSPQLEGKLRKNRKRGSSEVPPSAGVTASKEVIDALFAGGIRTFEGEPFVVQEIDTDRWSELDSFLAGGEHEVWAHSTNVHSIRYLPNSEDIIVTFKRPTGNYAPAVGRAPYKIDGCEEALARRFFDAVSKGRFVWDEFRRRGTVFGFKKHVYFLGDDAVGYEPKYMAAEEWQNDHFTIPPSGAVPRDWVDLAKAGEGPYELNYLRKAHPRGRKYSGEFPTDAPFPPLPTAEPEPPPVQGEPLGGKRKRNPRGKGKGPHWYD